jgi:hypothetical protein
MRLIRVGDVVGQALARAGAHAIWRTGTIGLLLAGACATHQAPPPETQAVVDLNASGGETSAKKKTRVRVENQNLAEMTIYVYRGSQRMRLGRASGNGVTNLEIPPSMVNGMTELRFFAEPMGRQRGTLSEPIPVSPGDLVDFMVPPR